MALTGFDMGLLQQKYNAMSKQADAAMISAMNSGRSGSSGIDGTPALNPLQQQLIEAQIRQAQSETNKNASTASAIEDDQLIKKRLEDQSFNSNTPSQDQLEGYYKAKVQLEKEAQEKAKNAAVSGVPGAKRGLTKVPGKGSGKVDTKPMMLAPGEAVLNKAAAEHLGRGVIKALNALGRQKMGMV